MLLVQRVHFEMLLGHPRQPGGEKDYSQELTMARSAIASSAFLAWCLENIRMICGMGSFSEANCDDEGEWEESPPATYLERLRPA